jgi:putative oxidoreductase
LDFADGGALSVCGLVFDVFLGLGPDQAGGWVFRDFLTLGWGICPDHGFFGIFSPSVGAYAQIFPRAMETVGYDSSQLSLFHTLVVLAGTWAEFILPFLIVIGFLTHLAALGMIGFVILQSLTDLYGHGAIDEAATVGAWFDKIPDATIMDQRALWVFLLFVLVIKGAGPLSVDRLLFKNAPSVHPASPPQSQAGRPTP